MSYSSTCIRDEESLSFPQRALKRQRRIDVEDKDKYGDTRFLLASSNICERLFSVAGLAYSDRRKNSNPVNLEAQLFLHFNNDLWTITDVNELTL